MRHKNKKNKAGKKSGFETSLKRNLAASLILNENIKTTEKRSKILIPFFEHLVTISKEKNLHNKRKINTLLNHKEAEKKLFNELSKKISNKNGGYVRTYKLGVRKGDNANMVRVEII